MPALIVEMFECSLVVLLCRYHAKESAMTSEVYHYKRGAGQAFNQTSHTIQPGKYPEEDVGLFLILCFFCHIVCLPFYHNFVLWTMLLFHRKKRRRPGNL